MPKYRYNGTEVEFELEPNWQQYCEGGTHDGAASWNNLADATIKGLPGTIGLLKKVMPAGAEISITSGWRSAAYNASIGSGSGSQHLTGAAIDIVVGDHAFMKEFAECVSRQSFVDGDNPRGSAWYMGASHEGTGYHIHLDNYLGGLADETPEQLKELESQCARTGGIPKPGNGNFNPNNTAGGPPSSISKDCQIQGNTIFINPRGATFAEPMYPDLQYVAGNIPNSLIEQIISDNNGKVADLKASASPYKTLSGTAMKDLTGLDFGGFTTDVAQAERQKVYDATKSRNEMKLPSGGKPLNNHDRYPVDLKAEELETHQPQVKQNEISFRHIDDDKAILAASILTGLDHAEKRIVKLENVLATVMRYVWGMGGRMFVNCVYYGGQDHRAKYKCIRCMKDDRVNDGQVMQIDQCLSCSRYEPIYGQSYEILNELGANLGSILDDCQMGYQNMRDYLKFTRSDQHPEKRLDVRFDPSQNAIRDQAEKDFKDEWDEGIKMKWRLVPVEGQKPNTNWRQDINHPDGTPKKLPSYQYNPANAGQTGSNTAAIACAITAGQCKEIMAKHYAAMKNSSDAEVQRWYKEGEEHATGSGGACLATINNMNADGYAQVLKDVSASKGVDPLLMLSIFSVESKGKLHQTGSSAGTGGGIGQVQSLKGRENQTTAEEEIGASIDCLKGKMSDKDGGNPIFGVTAYNCGEGNLELCQKLRGPDQMFDQNWVTTLNQDMNGKPVTMAYWPKVVCAYAKFVTMPEKLSALANGDGTSNFEFPFIDEKLKDVKFVKDYEVSNQGNGASSINQAIEFSCPNGSEIHASTQGVVRNGGEKDPQKGDWIDVDYGNGEHIIYCNMLGWTDKTKKMLASKGGSGEEAFKQGEVIGTSTEKLTIIYMNNGKPDDPKKKWRSLNGKVSDQDSLGTQIQKGENSATTPKDFSKVVVGGAADGSYDMDDDNNYIWKEDDKKVVKEKEKKNAATAPGDKEDENHSHGKAPNGKYYSNNDWDYLKKTNPTWTDEQIKAVLNEDEKYKETKSEEEKKATTELNGKIKNSIISAYAEIYSVANGTDVAGAEVASTKIAEDFINDPEKTMERIKDGGIIKIDKGDNRSQLIVDKVIALLKEQVPEVNKLKKLSKKEESNKKG